MELKNKCAHIQQADIYLDKAQREMSVSVDAECFTVCTVGS